MSSFSDKDLNIGIPVIILNNLSFLDIKHANKSTKQLFKYWIKPSFNCILSEIN
jgi:hypothetical protein